LEPVPESADIEAEHRRLARDHPELPPAMLTG